ncbi:MAG: hypothetical protein ACI3Y7_08245 [Candidatus Cryptobacteroides sp.]
MHEGLSRQCEAVKVGFECDSCDHKAFRLPEGGHIHPRRVQGEGPVGSKFGVPASDSEVG